jgi:hypothetical protein
MRVLAASALMIACSGNLTVAHAQKAPDFGDDKSRWARDGECDDRRFAGRGMTATILLDSDVGHDASDCRAAWKAGRLQLATSGSQHVVRPNFGDDEGDWANDEECDDPRFGGRGMTDTTLLAEDVLHDASDCRAAWSKGELRLIGIFADGTPDFGEDDGAYSEDGQCDDLRFVGPAVSDVELLADDIMHDASDCEAAWDDGEIELR